MATNDIPESRKAVRTYSWEVEERLPPDNDAHALGLILADEKGDIQSRTAPWRRFFDPRDETENDQLVNNGVLLKNVLELIP
jgi:hypothetical protein